MTQSTTYDAYGYVDKAIDQKKNSTNTIVALNLDYSFNVQRGTLNNRKNNKFGWNENFGYDNLDRLKTISGSVSKTMTFDNRGRITKNTDIGDYAYESNNVYRLKEITPNTKGSTYYDQHPTQQITYNAFKKPVEITEEGHGRASFEYSPMLNRSHSYYGGTQANKEERRYHKHYSAIIPTEIVEDTQTGSTKIITYIAGDAYSAPIAHIKKTGSGALNEFHYLHRDYLGSIMAITDGSGDLKEQRQFGAWGTIDKYWSSTGATVFTHNSLLGRGYTGHEHFFEVGLIHINGRMYDANIGRFLSPDNFIQDPYNTQSFNRYGYVLNNPLLYNDKSGEFFFIAVAIGAAIGAITQALKPGANFGSILGGALIGAAGGMIGAGVGSVVVGGGFFSSAAISSSMGFWGGAASGFIGGFAGGFVGGAGTAWLNGANFGNGLGAGLKAGLVGGALGGAINGISSGIRAGKNGLDFWSGEGSMDASMNLIDVASGGNSIEYSNESAQYFSDAHSELSRLSKNVDGLYADGSAPSSYKAINGQIYNSRGNPVAGVTSIKNSGILGLRKSINVHLSKIAFANSKSLYMVMHHEYMHAFFINSGLNIGKIHQEQIINRWHVDQMKSWGYQLPMNPYNHIAKGLFGYKFNTPKLFFDYSFFGFRTIDYLP